MGRERARSAKTDQTMDTEEMKTKWRGGGKGGNECKDVVSFLKTYEIEQGISFSRMSFWKKNKNPHNSKQRKRMQDWH